LIVPAPLGSEFDPTVQASECVWAFVAEVSEDLKAIRDHVVGRTLIA
jgi:hypothetical protein